MTAIGKNSPSADREKRAAPEASVVAWDTDMALTRSSRRTPRTGAFVVRSRASTTRLLVLGGAAATSTGFLDGFGSSVRLGGAWAARSGGAGLEAPGRAAPTATTPTDASATIPR